MADRRSTIQDVAALAGVSIKTVSRVVNREPNVREATKQKVEKAIAQLGYSPNPSAQNLASHRARLVVLIYDDPSAYEVPSSGYIIRLQEGALRACHENGFELLIHPCNYRDENVGAELGELISRVRPAGIVLAQPLSNMPDIVNAVRAIDAPCVRLATGSDNGKEYSVATNDREACAEMTRHLASLGHRRIAFIAGDRDHKAVANRLEGYKDGLEQAGLAFAEELIAQGDNSLGSGERCAEQLLRVDPRPTVLFCANDDMAAGAMRLATRLGISVPKELSIVGFDDISLARQIFPALTTIRQPLGAMAREATLALIEGSRGRPREAGLDVIPATIQIRESTGPAPSAN